jgi:hypothetical protein
MVALVLVGVGCSAPPPPPQPPPAPTAEPSAAPEAPAPPSKEALQTGNDCVKAESECGGGVCTATLKNNCDQAVTCDLAITTTCKAGTAMVEAAGRKRDTFAGKSDGELKVGAKCNEGEIVRTEVKSMACK